MINANTYYVNGFLKIFFKISKMALRLYLYIFLTLILELPKTFCGDLLLNAPDKFLEISGLRRHDVIRKFI